MLRGIKIDSESQEKRTKELLKDTEIIYDDRYLMVLNKPSGVLSTPGKGEVLSMEEYIWTTYGLPYCQSVHRLDQDTSGLLVLAKTPEVYKTLQSYFQRRDILKRYEAVCKPNLKSKILNLQSEGQIDLSLLPNPYDRPRQMVDREHGKPAITHYHIRERRPNGALLVDFYPLTGRTHQLRVHAAHPEGLNAPIVGDRLYGQAAERLMLHAAEIRFVHPVTLREMHFCEPAPEWGSV
jgi:tRNA pseudouridine32 synthase/23S rRNA pseudouridine746 synthase